MKNFVSTFLFLSLSGNILLAQTDSLQSKILQVTDLQTDFNFLRKVLQETHSGLYRYTPKTQMQAKMDSIANLLTEPMPFYAFYRVLAAFITDIRCAHTHVVPKKDIEKFYLNEIKTFPFSILELENKWMIALNGTLSPEIEVNSEVLSINGKTMESIKSLTFRYLWADGYIESSKRNAFSEAYFPLFYYLLVEQVDSFELTYKNPQGETKTAKVAAQKWAETSKNFAKNPANQAIIKAYKSKNRKNNKKSWRLEFLLEQKTALMTIRNFGGGRNEEEAGKKMQTFLNDCMQKMKAKKTENLIIDLRYNGGGWDIQGAELFTFLSQKPARYYQHIRSITDSSEFFRFSDLSLEDLRNVKKELQLEPDGTFSLKEEFNEQLKIQMPKSNHFTGKIYFLMNGGSASAASEFLAMAKSNQLGVFVGEETGGAYEGGNGGSFLSFELPHSKIKIGTPLLYYDNAVVPPTQKGRGTLPDYAVPNNFSDLFKGIDTQLNFVLDLIRKEK